MTNIVERLREFGAFANPGGIYENLPFEAADELDRLTAERVREMNVRKDYCAEIERLRALLSEAETWLGGFDGGVGAYEQVEKLRARIRAALEHKP